MWWMCDSFQSPATKGVHLTLLAKWASPHYPVVGRINDVECESDLLFWKAGTLGPFGNSLDVIKIPNIFIDLLLKILISAL